MMAISYIRKAPLPGGDLGQDSVRGHVHGRISRLELRWACPAGMIPVLWYIRRCLDRGPGSRMPYYA